MKLELDRGDLTHSHKDVNTSLVTFRMFTKDVQAVIKMVGRATFYESDRTSYNAIRPPKDVDRMEKQEIIDELFSCGAAIEGQWTPYPDMTALRGFLTAVREGTFDPETATDDDRKKYMMRAAKVY